MFNLLNMRFKESSGESCFSLMVYRKQKVKLNRFYSTCNYWLARKIKTADMRFKESSGETKLTFR